MTIFIFRFLSEEGYVGYLLYNSKINYINTISAILRISKEMNFNNDQRFEFWGFLLLFYNLKYCTIWTVCEREHVPELHIENSLSFYSLQSMRTLF